MNLCIIHNYIYSIYRIKNKEKIVLEKIIRNMCFDIHKIKFQDVITNKHPVSININLKRLITSSIEHISKLVLWNSRTYI